MSITHFSNILYDPPYGMHAAIIVVEYRMANVGFCSSGEMKSQPGLCISSFFVLVGW